MGAGGAIKPLPRHAHTSALSSIHVRCRTMDDLGCGPDGFTRIVATLPDTRSYTAMRSSGAGNRTLFLKVLLACYSVAAIGISGRIWAGATRLCVTLPPCLLSLSVSNS